MRRSDSQCMMSDLFQSSEHNFLHDGLIHHCSSENMDAAQAAMGSLQLATNHRMLNKKPPIGHLFLVKKCVKTMFLQYHWVKGFPNFSKKLEKFGILILERIKNGIFRHFIGVSEREQNFFPIIMVSRLFCKKFPSRRMMWFYGDNPRHYHDWMIKEKCRRRAFEFAMNGTLVPFIEGRTSLTVYEFRMIVEIVLDSMKSWYFGFLQIIDSETTCGGVGDCPVSDEHFDGGMEKPTERMEELHQSRLGLRQISAMIETLERYLRELHEMGY